MGDPKERPKQNPNAALDISGVRVRGTDAAHPSEGAFSDAITEAVRGAIELARLSGERVAIAVRGDPTRGMPMRMIEGVVLETGFAADGRERVVVGVVEDTSQFVLLERIVKVTSAA